MSNSQRRKGHSFERKIARQLKEVGINCRRGQQYASGSTEPDIVILDQRFSHYWPELKCGARPNIFAAMRQAIEACGPDRTPIAICHKDRDLTLVSVRLDDFLNICELIGFRNE